jgi:hypothetical protein
MDRNTLNDLLIAPLLILAWGGTSAVLFWQLRSGLDHFAIKEIQAVVGLFFSARDRSYNCERVAKATRHLRRYSRLS